MTSYFVPINVEFESCIFKQRFDPSYSLHVQNYLTRDEFASIIVRLNVILDATRNRLNPMWLVLAIGICIQATLLTIAALTGTIPLFYVVFGLQFLFLFTLFGVRFRTIRSRFQKFQSDFEAACQFFNAQYGYRGINFIARATFRAENYRHEHYNADNGMLIELSGPKQDFNVTVIAPVAFPPSPVAYQTMPPTILAINESGGGEADTLLIK